MKSKYMKPTAEWVSFLVGEPLMSGPSVGGTSIIGGGGVRPQSDSPAGLNIFNDNGTIG